MGRQALACGHCLQLIDSPTPARCPYCWQPMCSAFLRDCESAHIELKHPRSSAAQAAELDQTFPPEESP